MPVDFETGSAKLTGKGRDAVTFLAKYLIARGADAGPYFLTGHTDQRGSARQNCELSKRRIEAVVSSLRQSGVGDDFKIQPIAVGSSQPFEIVDAEDYSKEEIDRINRRVELRTSGVLEKVRCSR